MPDWGLTLPRISRVTSTDIGLNYGWMFDLRTVDELFDYLDNVRAPRARAELVQAMNYVRGLEHANIVVLMAEAKGISVIDAQLSLNEKIMRGMERVLFEDKQIFANGVGGYFGSTKGIKVHESRDIDVWALPKEEPRFIQWPGGEHWYAKIGDEDIVVDGKQKWDTKAEAEKAAMKYLKGKRR